MVATAEVAARSRTPTGDELAVAKAAAHLGLAPCCPCGRSCPFYSCGSLCRCCRGPLVAMAAQPVAQAADPILSTSSPLPTLLRSFRLPRWLSGWRTWLVFAALWRTPTPRPRVTLTSRPVEFERLSGVLRYATTGSLTSGSVLRSRSTSSDPALTAVIPFPRKLLADYGRPSLCSRTAVAN